MLTKRFLPIIILLALSFTHSPFARASETAHKNDQSVVQSTPVSGAKAEDLYKISNDDIVLGEEKAKVTVIEYASMTCSHCADFHKNAYQDIKKRYIDTGKIKFVFRAFPLDEPALRGSMLARCAGPQRFYKFTDVMFSTQPNWAYAKNYLEILSNIGKLGGLSGEEFEKCMANTDLEKKIMQAKFDATSVLSVRSTPSFFINGNIYKGAHNFEYFSKVLDEALAEKPTDLQNKNKEAGPAKKQ
jgi:hypothetical protein